MACVPGEEERDDATLDEPVPEDDDSIATFFEEKDVCTDILRDAASHLPFSWTTVVPNETPIVGKLQLFEKHLQKYQEAPQLIKHHLRDLVEPLMAMIVARMPESALLATLEKDTAGQRPDRDVIAGADGLEYDVYDVDAPRTPLHHLCRSLYVVVKVAGAKSCTSFFPCDVKLFESLCYNLMHWHRHSALEREWEVRYCLILWLSNLILVPFAIHSIDSALVQEGGPLSQQLLLLAVELLGSTSKCREAAALLIARLMARADAGAHRTEFFQLVTQWLQPDSGITGVKMHGVLQALATTLKYGKRRELLPYISSLIPLVCSVAEAYSTQAQVCKTAVKVVQRLGLCLLRQKQAPWRYIKSTASLEINLQQQSTGQQGQQPAAPLHEADSDDDDIDSDEGLEDVIGLLIQCLSHGDTIVRWSAAKGIGRVCMRLPKAMADDVVDAFMEVFQVSENDSGWHGGMLALAELCRRSMLLPARFDIAVPIIAKGLTYDLGRGTYSVGAHVRDAACYVCWSVARAYNAVDLEPYVHRLSNTLVVASLFDREVNVRRAASAALQECVGRLGNFPDGIDLVTTMDFFSLATMRGSFLAVAPRVAVYDAYRMHIVETLVNVKLVHWDKDVRKTAAISLGKLAPLCTLHLTSTIVPDVLLPRVKDATLASRHGAIFALAEIVANIPADAWEPAQIAQLADIVPYLDAGRHFRGRGGEFVRQACLRLLEAFAERHVPLPEFVEVAKVSGDKAKARTLGKLQVFYEDTWKQILEWVQLAAVSSYKVFARCYFASFQEAFHGKVIAQMLEASGEGKPAMERRGTVLALGAVPPVLLTAISRGNGDAGKPYYDLIAHVLDQASTPEANADLRDAETRRNAVRSLADLTTSLTSADDVARVVDAAAWQRIMAVMRRAFNDYAVDKRGDVGSFVRVQAMLSCVQLFRWAATRVCSVVPPRDLLDLLGCLLQQTTEKIDKVRGVGGQALHDILSDPAVVSLLFSSISNEEDVADVEALRVAFSDSCIADWSSPTELFSTVVPPLLKTRLFAEHVLEGIVVSVGGLSVHVLKPSLDALVLTFKADRGAHAARLSHLLVHIAAKHVHDDRFVVPLCLTMDRLMSLNLLAESCWGDLADIVVHESKHFATDIQKLLPLVGVLGTLCRAADADVRDAAWLHALSMIASRYPKVRAKTATDLYTALLFLSGPDTNLADGVQLDKAMEHLLATTWDDSNATKVRAARNELYTLLALQKPAADAGDMKSGSTARRLKAGSYSSLVHEAGY